MPTCAVIVQPGEKLSTPGDPGRTARGVHQAGAVGETLARHRPVAIVSSPLLRPRMTAARIAEAVGAPVVLDARLRERMNLEPGEDPGAFARDWERSTREPDWSRRGGRSSRAVAQDMRAALRAHSVDGHLVAFVGHGGATVDLLRDLLGDAALEHLAPGLLVDGVPGGAMTWLEAEDGRWRATAVAEIRHLPVGARSGHRPV